MKLHEAVTLADMTGKWCRPICWKNTGQAYAISEGYTKLVPSLRGGVLGMTPCIMDLKGDWEVIAPADVLAENKLTHVD